jgi:hypothetical protein
LTGISTNPGSSRSSPSPTASALLVPTSWISARARKRPTIVPPSRSEARRQSRAAGPLRITITENTGQ